MRLTAESEGAEPCELADPEAGDVQEVAAGAEEEDLTQSAKTTTASVRLLQGRAIHFWNALHTQDDDGQWLQSGMGGGADTEFLGE